MALTLYQEQIPFSNKKTDFPVSSNGKYINPVIMSFAFDFTICTNFLETVLYIRNDDINKWYKNIVITLCKSDNSIVSPLPVIGVLKETLEDGPYFTIGDTEKIPVSFSTETHLAIPSAGYSLINQYTSDVIPVTDYVKPLDGLLVQTDDNINARFSFGYDELSNVEWQNKKPGLVIPYIGNRSLADTSYIPVRLRLLWKSASSLFTIRDYFIDVSYEAEAFIGADL